MKRHGEAASSSAETVEQERKRIRELIKESGYGLRDIYNMDETGLFYGYAPDMKHLDLGAEYNPQNDARQRTIRS
jgi:hypothetical protein